MRLSKVLGILLTLTLFFSGVSCGKCDTTAPSIANVSVSNITYTSATVTWTTSEPSHSQVEYELNTSFGTSFGTSSSGGVTVDAALVTDHSLDLFVLKCDATYRFMVSSRDDAGNEAISDYYSFTTTDTASGLLTVHFIDVGQGDAILVDLGDTEVLIDGGDRSPGVTAYLEDYVNGSLEVMIATHPHADHIGGLIEVLDDFDVEEIWLNGDTSTSKTYSDFITKVNAEGAEVYEATWRHIIVTRGLMVYVLNQLGLRFIAVGGLMFDVLNPFGPLVDDINNNSIVLMMSYCDTDFLFMGDAEEEAESSMIAAGALTDIDILKVGHHGSRSSSSQAFLNIVQPEVAIYMAGEDNTYGHPHPETITALEDIGAEVYGTDVCGTITVTTNGSEYIISGCTP